MSKRKFSFNQRRFIMKQFAFSKLVRMAAIAVISVFFSLGCTEDPASSNNGGGSGGGGDSNSSGDGNSSSGGGGGGGTAVSQITIENKTGYSIQSLHIKPTTSTDWGSNISISLSDGESKAIALSKPLSTGNKYDIQLSTNRLLGSGDAAGNIFTKYNLSVDGRTITFTTGDNTDESEFPSITIQNRSGVNFNAIYVRPSSVPESSSDWGRDYRSLSNNSDQSITIPIPPSNYTVFDIQMKSSNPTNTYTKKNVTVTDGMVVMYTSADRENPTIELPVIVIQNNTGYSIQYLHIKQPNSTDWGSNTSISLSDGTSRTATLPQSLSTNDKYDIQLSTNRLLGSGDAAGNIFTKYNVTISEGMILTFTTSDLAE
jgi:predicted secreted protein